MNLTNIIVQTVIALSGVAAIAMLVLGGESARKWSPVVGIVGQPFWLYASWMQAQWGMFSISVAYTLVWGGGVIKIWRAA